MCVPEVAPYMSPVRNDDCRFAVRVFGGTVEVMVSILEHRTDNVSSRDVICTFNRTWVTLVSKSKFNLMEIIGSLGWMHLTEDQSSFTVWKD